MTDVKLITTIVCFIRSNSVFKNCHDYKRSPAEFADMQIFGEILMRRNSIYLQLPEVEINDKMTGLRVCCINRQFRFL
jgi:hypothetical protein